MQVNKHFIGGEGCNLLTTNSQNARKRKRNEWSNLNPANTVRQ